MAALDPNDPRVLEAKRRAQEIAASTKAGHPPAVDPAKPLADLRTAYRTQESYGNEPGVGTPGRLTAIEQLPDTAVTPQHTSAIGGQGNTFADAQRERYQQWLASTQGNVGAYQTANAGVQQARLTNDTRDRTDRNRLSYAQGVNQAGQQELSRQQLIQQQERGSFETHYKRLLEELAASMAGSGGGGRGGGSGDAGIPAWFPTDTGYQGGSAGAGAQFTPAPVWGSTPAQPSTPIPYRPGATPRTPGSGTRPGYGRPTKPRGGVGYTKD